MKGSVYKRCPCGITGGGGTRPPACKKAHGTWNYVVDLEVTGNAKRQQERKGGFRTKDDAEDALSELVNRIRIGEYVHDSGMSVGDYLDEWLAGKLERGAIRRGTHTLYEGHIRKYWKPQLGRVRLRDLRVPHIQRALKNIGADGTLGAATIRRIHNTLRSALSTAVKQQLIGLNPAVNVELPATKRPKVNPWTAEQLGAFLDYVAPNRFAALFEVAAATGMRRGEVCGLRWDDVDLVERVLTVSQQIIQNNVKVRPTKPCEYCGVVHPGLEFGPPKTASGEGRIVELDSHTVAALLEHRLRQDAERGAWGEAYVDHGLVFCRENGDPMPPIRVYEIFKELAVEVKLDDKPLPPTRLHDLRHAAASLRLKAGVDIAIVSKALGHSTTRLTQDTYQHLLPGVARDAAERANSLVPRRSRDHSVTSPAGIEVKKNDQAHEMPGHSGAGDGNRTRTVSLGTSDGDCQAVMPDE